MTKPVKHFLSGILMLWMLCAAAAPAVQAQDGPDGFPPEIGAALQAGIEQLAAEDGVPGLVLWLDTPTATFGGAAGVSNLADDTPMQPDDAFLIGSITKMFTATVILQLAEEGVLTLDDPLSKWLPELAARLPYGDQITLRQLLNHTAGVYNVTDSIDYLLLTNEFAGDAWDPLDSINFVIERDLVGHEPGAEFRYSNTGYLLLGLVIEAATGQPLHEVYRARIFEPLGMDNTYLGDMEPPTAEPVHGYNAFLRDVSDWHPSIAWAAGGIISTGPDMIRFIRGLAHGDLFRDPASFESMIAPGDLSPQYGYGVALNFDGAGTWGHDGGTPGFMSLAIYYPEVDGVLVLLANTGNMPPPIALSETIHTALDSVRPE